MSQAKVLSADEYFREPFGSSVLWSSLIRHEGRLGEPGTTWGLSEIGAELFCRASMIAVVDLDKEPLGTLLSGSRDLPLFIAIDRADETAKQAVIVACLQMRCRCDATANGKKITVADCASSEIPVGNHRHKTL